MFQTDDGFSRYLASLRQSPRLSREAEEELTRRWRGQRDRAAADELARAHLGYVLATAVRYRRYGVPLAELCAEGNFGVVHALEKFDPDRGIRFVTYASHWIRAYMVNHIIQSWSLVGGGRGALRSKLFFKLRRERRRMANLVGDGERADELVARRLNIPRREVGAMLERLEHRDLSLETPVHDDGASTLTDTLPSSDPDQAEQLAGHEKRAILQDAVGRALGGLDPRERYIVEQRVMADAGDEVSLAELGRRLGVTRERARQLEARAKRKLRRRLSRQPELARMMQG